ncbi:MAG: acetolactate synthase small subunit [Leptospiraceae bacterium]|nr:acetolactate synthase small subunit [Leptospiraceae bacterium]
MKHILSITVHNRPGVMSQVSGLFTRRAFNIDSIAVGTTEDPAISSMTIVMKGDETELAQFESQMLKLADVIQVRVIPFHSSVTREIMLVRVKAGIQDRADVLAIVDVFEGNILEIAAESILIEVFGNNRRIKSMIQLLNQYGIIDMARTGQIALAFENDD